MHQPMECLPTNREALDLLAELAERHNGSITLRRYSKSTAICDTQLHRPMPDRYPDTSKVPSPTWIVSVGKGLRLGVGSTAEEAIRNAVQADFRLMVSQMAERNRPESPDSSFPKSEQKP